MLRDIVVRTFTYVYRAHAPANHATSHDDHDKPNACFSDFLACIMAMGLCPPALCAAKELRYDHFELKNIAFDEKKFPMLI